MTTGHHPSHIRETFLEALDAYRDWIREGGELPTVAFERNYVEQRITLLAACRLVWNCPDLMPGHVMSRAVRQLGLDVRRRTYAAVAQAMAKHMEARGVLA